MASNTLPLLPDREARERAATDFGNNLVVLAGAGTGKTSLLVERVLNAIGSGVAKMPEIAAITFTEKAAGEMRERLALGLERLRALARDEVAVDPCHEADRAWRHLIEKAEVDSERIAKRTLAAMEALDHGTVVTIHRFCSELLRSFPFEAGVDPGFAVDSGELKEQGIKDPFISARSAASLNYRPLQRMIDPEVNLMEKKYSVFRHSDWILPLKE